MDDADTNQCTVSGYVKGHSRSFNANSRGVVPNIPMKRGSSSTDTTCASVTCEAERQYRSDRCTISNLASLLVVTSSYLLLVCTMGLIFGLASTGFHEMIHLISHFWKDTVGEAIRDHVPDWWFPCVHMSISTVVSGCVVGFIVWKYIPTCEGGGTNAVKVCLQMGAEFPFHVAVSRFFITSLYIGGGNPLGSEAPILHICSVLAACFYDFVVRMFGEHRFSRQNLHALVIVGCSCGLSAAFNTPLGGILYALEEFYENSSISPRLLSIWIALGSSSALTVHRLLKGNAQYFDVSTSYGSIDVEPWMWIAMPLAFLCAAISHAFMFLVLHLRQFRYDHVHNALAVGIGSLMVTLLASATYVASNAVGYPTYTWGVSPEPLTKMIANKCTWQPVFYAIAKFFMCAIAVAFGGSGGLFTPALLLGGSIGVSVSALLQHDIVDDSTTSILAMCGMTAFFSALLRLPLTSAIVSYEMTSHLSSRNNVFLPVVLSSITAYYFADLLSPFSLHHCMMHQDGVFQGGAAPDEKASNASRESAHSVKDSETDPANWIVQSRTSEWSGGQPRRSLRKHSWPFADANMSPLPHVASKGSLSSSTVTPAMLPRRENRTSSRLEQYAGRNSVVSINFLISTTGTSDPGSPKN